MHTIVKQFIETDRAFTEILNEVGDPNQPVEVIFPIVSSKMNKSHLDEKTFNKIDEAIKYGHYDEEVFLLFISYLIVFYCIHEMREKSESIYRISFGFDVNKYQIEIQAYYHQSCAYYYHFAEEFAKRDELNLLALSLMPKSSPRYYKFLANTGQILGIDGRLYLLPQEDLHLLEIYSEKDFVPLSCLLNNALYIMDLKLVEKYYSLMLSRYKDDIRYDNDRFLQSLNILKGVIETKPIEPVLTNLMTYYDSLKNHNLESAKKLFGNLMFYKLTSLSFFMFTNLRFHHAFVTGGFEIIEDILISKKKDYHYMIDFFMVRYFLVKEKKDLARLYYIQLLKNCEKYHAMARLKFEMQFAFELTAFSFFELTQPLQLSSPELTNAIDDSIIASNKVAAGVFRIIGETKVVLEIKKKIKKFSNIQRPILIIGETGVGKEVVARAIHEESNYHDKPFLAINCGALTDTLLQSELFGYEAGAFTGAVTARKGIFEAAEEGVVFLDEFGEMSSKLQVSLLRVLENNELLRVGGTKTRKIKCRIIAATNANIEDLIEKKLFREDLYHRLKQFSILIPPLRERKEDISLLIDYFLNKPNSKQIQTLSKELAYKFQEYHWPGNIRELKNEIDRIKILSGYKPIVEIEDVEMEWAKPTEKKDIAASLPNQQSGNDDLMHQRIKQKKLTLADKRNLKLIQLFQQYKQLTRGQIAEALEINLLTATKDLQRLCKEEVIVKKTPTLSPRSHFFELK